MPFTKDASKDGNKKITETLSAEKYPNTVRKNTERKKAAEVNLAVQSGNPRLGFDAPDGKAKKAPAFADALNFAHIK